MTNVLVPCLLREGQPQSSWQKTIQVLKELWYDYNGVKQAENIRSQLVTPIQGVTDNSIRETENNRRIWLVLNTL